MSAETAGQSAQAGTAPATESFPVEVRRLLDTARRELDQHVSQGGCCVFCHLPWPCARKSGGLRPGGGVTPVESHTNAHEPGPPPQTQGRHCQRGRSSVARRESAEPCSSAGPASTPRPNSGSTSAHAPDASMGAAHAAGGGTGAVQESAGGLLGHGGSRAPVPPSHHGHDPARWPLCNALPLGALEGAVPSARAHVRQLLWEWRRAELAADVGVVVSELVTNAVLASAELRPDVAPLLVWFGSDADCVLAAVADASPRPPVRLDLPPDAEGGRGLALVAALSSRWGWHPIKAAGLVKVVWAEFRVPQVTGQRPAITEPGPE